MQGECAVLIEGLSMNSVSVIEMNQRWFGLGEGWRVEANGLPLLPGPLHLKADSPIQRLRYVTTKAQGELHQAEGKESMQQKEERCLS